MKAIEDKNRAVDQAFLLGQKSVCLLQDFSEDELRLLEDLVRQKKSGLSYSTWESEFVQKLLFLEEKIKREINRRDGH